MFAGVLRSDVVVDERGIMVLLEKQVHLQKDVGAERALVSEVSSIVLLRDDACTYRLRETVRGMRGRERGVASLIGPWRTSVWCYYGIFVCSMLSHATHETGIAIAITCAQHACICPVPWSFHAPVLLAERRVCGAASLLEIAEEQFVRMKASSLLPNKTYHRPSRATQ